MIFELLERIFPNLNDRNSGTEVKNRLKLVLAHDRAAIAPEILEKMRQEIMAVVSKYVELDNDAMEISLDSSDRTTVLVANFPIRRVNPEFYTVKEGENDADLPEIVLDESLIGAGDVKAEVTEVAEAEETPVEGLTVASSDVDGTDN
jgi:cell division topological specificity factor